MTCGSYANLLLGLTGHQDSLYQARYKLPLHQITSPKETNVPLSMAPIMPLSGRR